jgi:hypothetical protein
MHVCTAFITLLLAVSTIAQSFLSLQEKEMTVVYVATETDPPDLEIMGLKARFYRFRRMIWALFWELWLTVLPHPVPGFRYTVEVQALDRVTKYEFESFIVLFMFGRLWHVWLLLQARLGDKMLLTMCLTMLLTPTLLFLQARLWDKMLLTPTYALGNKKSILAMFRNWDALDHKLAMKIFFREHAMSTLSTLFALLLLGSSYAVRVAEGPINPFHTTYFWNQMVLLLKRVTRLLTQLPIHPSPYTHTHIPCRDGGERKWGGGLMHT